MMPAAHRNLPSEVAYSFLYMYRADSLGVTKINLQSIISQKVLILSIWDLDQSISKGRFTIKIPSK